MKTNILLLALLISVSSQSIVHAHPGRRFEIKIVNGQLVTQGYLSGGGATDDGGGLIRPYYNALHDHWGNVGPVAIASLPGFDLHSPEGLLGYDLTLALIGAGKWTDPMNNTHGGHGGTPVLSGLAPDETIYIGFLNQQEVNTDLDPNDPNSFLIGDNIANAIADIDLEYSIFLNPQNTLYYLQWQLTTDAPGVADSDPIYTILSPDPMATNGLHHPSLALESHFGISSVPEPSAPLLLALGAFGAIARRRKR